MKRTVVIASLFLAVVAVALQRGLPPVLVKHTASLKEATALKAKLNVREVGGKTVTVEITYAKPNMLKIDTPTELIVSNGKTLTVLDKAENSYTERPVEKADLLARTSAPSVWGWASFMQADSAKVFKSGQASLDRKLRGVDVSQATVVLPAKDSTATMYIDKQTGVARGYMLKVGKKQWVVWAESIETSKAGVTVGTFDFVAPAGATLVEEAEAGTVAFRDVQALLNRSCMPCHGSRSTAGLDVRSYRTLMSSRVVVAGDAARSQIIRSLRGAGGARRMPQGRAPLSEANIKLVEAWINDGAKEK